MDFFRKTGMMALGSRLRMLSEKVTSDAAGIYEMYGTNLRPKWFPVYYALSDGSAKTVTAIAKEIGQTHPSVSSILKEMRQAGLVDLRQSSIDGRQTLASFSEEGLRLRESMEQQQADVTQAISEISQHSRADLWEAMNEWERLLGEKSLLQRVAAIKGQREDMNVRIVPFDDSRHHEAFRRLNEEWIKNLFGKVEDADHYEFDHPVENIINKGGYIFIALLNDEPVGTFAMMRSENPAYDYELVKYSVSPKAQGHGIGRKLMEACLAQARRTGGYRIFLESNRKCAAAVHLYEKYGFRHLPVRHSDYARCDVQMETVLQ